MNIHHLEEAVRGKLSLESIEEIRLELVAHALGKREMAIPSASAYRRQIRDATVVMAYKFMQPISPADFYRLFERAATPPPENDIIGLMLHDIHLLNKKFNISIDSPSTIERAIR